MAEVSKHVEDDSIYPCWESYPANLKPTNAYGINAAEHNLGLSQAHHNLFTQEDQDQHIKILHSGDIDGGAIDGIHDHECIPSGVFTESGGVHEERRIAEISGLYWDPYIVFILFLISRRHGLTWGHYSLIPQFDSWGQIRISFEAFRKLFTYLQIFAPFLSLVHALGIKSEPVEETFASSIFHQPDPTSTSFELCYLAKHIEQHGKDPAEHDDPYSLRQMAVYHGYQALNESHTFVVLNPSLTFQHHLKQARLWDLAGLGDWKNVHIALFYALSYRWREYVNLLEARFRPMYYKASGSTARKGKATFLLKEKFTRKRYRKSRIFAALELKRLFSLRDDNTGRNNPTSDDNGADNEEENYLVCFADTQKVQHFRQKVLTLDHVIKLNLKVLGEAEANIQEVQQLMKSKGDGLSDPVQPGEKGCLRYIQTYISETAVESQRVETLLRSIDGISAQIRTILDFREVDAARKLAAKAQRDSKTLKTIAMLTLIYLPATFAAVRSPSNVYYRDITC
ncbi:hypothetical protein K440DRAFT_685320 [Wilcoxina mikolae CBS 423.85]|nr:hypothetical protein K440DRAFT_685320 [Wilcoxina mikolae CBS 423.85]